MFSDPLVTVQGQVAEKTCQACQYWAAFITRLGMKSNAGVCSRPENQYPDMHAVYTACSDTCPYFTQRLS